MVKQADTRIGDRFFTFEDDKKLKWEVQGIAGNLVSARLVNNKVYVQRYFGVEDCKEKAPRGRKQMCNGK
jgi:hypothetical protein